MKAIWPRWILSIACDGINFDAAFFCPKDGVASILMPHFKRIGGENDMENEKRALSWREFVKSGFDGREYQFPDFEGTFAATTACKRWDRNKNLLAYLDFDDGRKIMTSAWSEKNYLGLADIPLKYPCKCFVPILCKGRFVPQKCRSNLNRGVGGIVLTSNESVRTDSACLGQCP